jgi:ubiquitin-protein ligase
MEMKSYPIPPPTVTWPQKPFACKKKKNSGRTCNKILIYEAKNADYK